MAGTSLGAPAPSFPAPVQGPGPTAYRIPAQSRTRRNHGVFIVGDQLACVYSSRRADDGKGVQLVLGHEGPIFTGGMSTTQARAVARALVAAADAAEEQRGGRA
jgi:hypothetical protein